MGIDLGMSPIRGKLRPKTEAELTKLATDIRATTATLNTLLADAAAASLHVDYRVIEEGVMGFSVRQVHLAPTILRPI